MEQDDRADAVGDLRKLLFADYNNGCLPQVNSTKAIVVHFLDKHPDHFILFRDLLAEAIKAYEDPLSV